ncbi:hypothetical protein BKA93DRAFT_753406 [Sparassis latifolia]
MDVLPLTPTPSGPLDELYPSVENSWAISIHIVLIVIQGVDILSSPLSPFFVAATFIAYSGTVLIVVYAFCLLLNKGVSGEFVYSDEHLLEGYEKRDGLEAPSAKVNKFVKRTLNLKGSAAQAGHVVVMKRNGPAAVFFHGRRDK